MENVPLVDLVGLAPEGGPVKIAPRSKLHVDENGEDCG